jgi:hypothetical protein
VHLDDRRRSDLPAQVAEKPLHVPRGEPVELDQTESRHEVRSDHLTVASKVDDRVPS